MFSSQRKGDLLVDKEHISWKCALGAGKNGLDTNIVQVMVLKYVVNFRVRSRYLEVHSEGRPSRGGACRTHSRRCGPGATDGLAAGGRAVTLLLVASAALVF